MLANLSPGKTPFGPIMLTDSSEPSNDSTQTQALAMHSPVMSIMDFHSILSGTPFDTPSPSNMNLERAIELALKDNKERTLPAQKQPI